MPFDPAAPAWPPPDRLSEYVTETCLVDYGRIAAQESEWLDPVLALVKKTNANTDADRHALLINAYNLWTIYWVIRERRYVLIRLNDPCFDFITIGVCGRRETRRPRTAMCLNSHEASTTRVTPGPASPG